MSIKASDFEFVTQPLSKAFHDVTLPANLLMFGLVAGSFLVAWSFMKFVERTQRKHARSRFHLISGDLSDDTSESFASVKSLPVHRHNFELNTEDLVREFREAEGEPVVDHEIQAEVGKILHPAFGHRSN